MRRCPEHGLVEEIERFPAPDRRSREDHAIHFRKAVRGHGGHHHGAAHALADEIDGLARIFLPHFADHGGEILDQQFLPRPDAEIRRLPEAPLVIGDGRQPLPHPPASRKGVGVAVVIEAMHGDQYCPGLFCFPGFDRQPHAVGGVEIAVAQHRLAIFRSRLLHHRGAGHGENKGRKT